MMEEVDADWPIRSVPGAAIVEHFLTHHFGYVFKGVDARAARDDITAALDHWVDLGLCHAASASGERLFDPVEVTNFMVSAGRRGDDGFWDDHQVATERGILRVQQGMPADSTAVPDPAALPPRRFDVRLERIYETGHLDAGSRMRLRLPLPIEDHALRDLSVTFHAPAGAQIERKPAMLDARMAIEVPGPIALSVDAKFEALVNTGDGERLDEEQRAVFTKPREGLICVSETISRLAHETVSSLAGAMAKVTALADLITARFQLGAVPYYALDPADPLAWSMRTRMVDCQIAATVLCALCRSIGIPARMASGYQLYVSCNGYHYWAEVWVEGRGWISLDFMDWHLSRGGIDREWCGILTGALDYRMKVQVLPHLFTGPSTIRLPEKWHVLTSVLPGGLETRFVDAVSGKPVYSDRLTLAR